MIATSTRKLLLEGIHDQGPVAGLTHQFYRYPARFSPAFTRAIIRAFSKPGDVVFDPFMGGGTTMVEATALGRRGVGTDINSLAVFVSLAKTALLDDRRLREIRRWADSLLPQLNLHRPPAHVRPWAELGYLRNINDRSTWRIRKLLALALAQIRQLRNPVQQRLARCILLKTAQWALDCRTEIPPAAEFRQQLATNAFEMVRAARKYARAAYRAARAYSSRRPFRPLCLHRSAIGIELDPAIAACRPIRLIVTSPPYPGVHVLYHRWQVQGRRETPAPFWIASSLDGNGEAHYTFGTRKQLTLNGYFERVMSAFRSIARVSDPETIVVQMIAFSHPKRQLPRYLAMMEEAGFAEVFFSDLATAQDGRIRRIVPNRKWYAIQRGALASSDEVVLFHRVA